jgi:hypothetical protein
MTLSRVNFFAPYENAPAWHENQLTRALLVVLRYSPIAHQVWLRLVDPELNLHDLPKPDFVTQRQRVLVADADPSDNETIPGISVFLAPDVPPVESAIEESDRQQVLDGIVTYGDDLVVVIENKIVRGAPTDQSHRINLHGSSVVFDPQPRSVSWQQLLAALSDVVARQLVSGAESLLLTDFLALVEEHFPEIGPHSTLERCGGHRFRVERRLDTLLGQVVNSDVGKAPGLRDILGSPSVTLAALRFAEDGSEVRLILWPADTLEQSRSFYADRAVVDSVVALRDEGWRVEPNFHWGFMATGYAWSKSVLSVDDYCNYWLREIGTTREVPRSEWDAYWKHLESAEIVTSSERAAFDATFTQSQRKKATPRPGLRCEIAWPLADAERLDSRGALVSEVRSCLNQLLAALRAPLIAG